MFKINRFGGVVVDVAKSCAAEYIIKASAVFFCVAGVDCFLCPSYISEEHIE